MIPLTRLSSVSSGRDDANVPVDESKRGGNDERWKRQGRRADEGGGGDNERARDFALRSGSTNYEVKIGASLCRAAKGTVEEGTGRRKKEGGWIRAGESGARTGGTNSRRAALIRHEVVVLGAQFLSSFLQLVARGA